MIGPRENTHDFLATVTVHAKQVLVESVTCKDNKENGVQELSQTAKIYLIQSCL